jgi:hypothetical protein
MPNLSKLLKLIVVILMIWLLYYQLISNDALSSIQTIWNSTDHGWKFTYLWLCLALMPLNWILEAYKWQILMSPHVKISFINACETVLVGLAVGIVTPARIGEYGGRMLNTDPNLKTEVVSATLLGSIAQNLCNVIIGFTFSYFFLKSNFVVTSHEHLTLIVVISLQLFVSMLLYFHLPKVVRMFGKLLDNRFVKKLGFKFDAINHYQKTTLLKVLLLSLSRYFVYFIQYLCILLFFGVSASVLEMSSGIAFIYLIQTGIPLPAFISILARGELAILVWGHFGISEVTSLVSTFSLWVINLIFPALLGLVILIRLDIVNFFKGLGSSNGINK